MLTCARRVDSELPDNLSDTLICERACARSYQALTSKADALNVLTTIVTVTAVTPVFLVAFFVLCVGYWHYARLYTQTARELRRLDSTSKSPLYAL